MIARLSLVVVAVLILSQLSLRAAGEPTPTPGEAEIPTDVVPPANPLITIEEQLKLRAAQVKAADDPDVLAALKKRDEAIAEFRMALRMAMIKADPRMEPILDKLSVDGKPGF
jgi:hypothetical protein